MLDNFLNKSILMSKYFANLLTSAIYLQLCNKLLNSWCLFHKTLRICKLQICKWRPNLYTKFPHKLEKISKLWHNGLKVLRKTLWPLTCCQSYKSSTIVIYDSRVIPDLKILHIMTLES